MSTVSILAYSQTDWENNGHPLKEFILDNVSTEQNMRQLWELVNNITESALHNLFITTEFHKNTTPDGFVIQVLFTKEDQNVGSVTPIRR